MLERTFTEEEEDSSGEEESPEENSSDDGDEPEYHFAGFDVEFSEKIELTRVMAGQGEAAKG